MVLTVLADALRAVSRQVNDRGQDDVIAIYSTVVIKLNDFPGTLFHGFIPLKTTNGAQQISYKY